MSLCRHESIRFGSGGHYIFCDGCPAVWCSNPQGDGLLTNASYLAAMSNVCQTALDVDHGRRLLRQEPSP